MIDFGDMSEEDEKALDEAFDAIQSTTIECNSVPITSVDNNDTSDSNGTEEFLEINGNTDYRKKK